MIASITTPKPLDANAITIISKDFVNRFPLSKYNSLAGIISALGGKLIYKNFLKDAYSDNVLEVTRKGDFTIYINVNCSFYTFAWTLCHGLGRYVLHYLYLNKENSDYTVDCETANREAIVFANILLSSYKLSPAPKSEKIATNKDNTRNNNNKVFA